MTTTPLRARWRREQFEPGLLGLLVNPFYFARHGLIETLRPLFRELTGEVLDVGCGSKPYRAHIPATQYVGLDVDNALTRSLGAADVFYDGKFFPLPDGRFDGVLCSQVLEHVFAPEAFLAEIRRVLRPGGSLLLTVPAMWDEHEQPHDYGRYTSFGLRALLERAGFEVIVQRKSMADARAVAQLASAWLYKVVVTRNRWVNLATQLALIAPVNVAGAVLGAVLPGNEDFYLDNVVWAKKRADGAAR
ncbi:MAG: methylase [Verrucomicrobia bacterium]|nr:methylase [Verrucomicrobiota bacterium]